MSQNADEFTCIDFQIDVMENDLGMAVRRFAVVAVSFEPGKEASISVPASIPISVFNPYFIQPDLRLAQSATSLNQYAPVVSWCGPGKDR